MAVKNSTILGKVWLNGTNDYQQRVPDPTQSNVSQTMKCLFSPMNGNLYNQFIDSFVNLIGQQRVNQSIWENPLTPFKGASLQYGSTIQESAPRWIKAHAYDDAAEDLLRMERPEFAVWYHSMNRQDKYPISVVKPEIQQAFRDEYGLNRIINSIMNTPINSDNYDEYLLMLNLIAEYEHRWGFFKHNLSAFPTDEATGKELLTALRTYAELLKFPSTLYNAADLNVPVFAKPSELVLLISASASASVDVNTLSGVFQLDKAEIQYRKIVVPDLPVPNAVALLTTDAFFVCNDIVYETGSFYDPNTLSTKYILHHWEIVSASPFVPAILFTTDAGTEIPTVTQTVTGLQLSAASETVKPGETVQLTPTIQGSLSPDDNDELAVSPDAATWSVAATRTTGESPNQTTVAVPLNSRTYVDKYGVLHVQKTKLQTGDVITVTATSTYINPSGATTEYTATATVTVE